MSASDPAGELTICHRWNPWRQAEHPEWWPCHPGTHSTKNYCTRCFHFSPKCTKIVGGWGFVPDPTDWRSLHIPRIKSMTTGWKSNLMNASSRNTHYSKSLHQNVTRCFHFSPKCSKIVGGWGSAPDPAEGAYIILPLLKSMTHYSKSLHLMLPF